MHCNPITHFDAFGLYDQDDIDARQAQQDEKQAQYDADYEAWKNSDMSPQQRRAQSHSFANRRSELEQSQSEINDMQKELDNNRWGNTDMTGVWDAQHGMIGNTPYLRRWDYDKGKWRYSAATEKEMGMFFAQDSNGNYAPISGQDIGAANREAIGNMAGSIDKELTPFMYAAAYTPVMVLGGNMGYGYYKAAQYQFYKWGAATTLSSPILYETLKDPNPIRPTNLEVLSRLMPQTTELLLNEIAPIGPSYNAALDILVSKIAQ